MDDIPRRTALCLLGTGLTLLAGCADSDAENGDDGESGDDTGADTADDADTDDAETETIELGELPEYASILADTDDAEYLFGAIEFETLTEEFDDDEPDEGPGDDDLTDPLVVNPLTMALIGSVMLFSLGFSDFAGVQSENERSGEEGQLLFVNGVTVFTGAYDLEGVAEGLSALGYEASVDESNRVVYYSERERTAVGATDELFAFAFADEEDPEYDPVAELTRYADAAVGETAAKHEVDEEFEWLLRAGNIGGTLLCLYTDDDEFDESGFESDEEIDTDPTDDGADEETFDAFIGAKGFHQHLEIDGEDAFARTVVLYASDDRVDEDRLRDALGTDADAVEFTSEENAAVAEAEYRDDVLEE